MENTSAPAKPESRPYVVTLRFKFPAWDEKQGIQYEVSATCKKDAVRSARRRASDDGHLCGRPVTEYSFSAQEVE